MKESDIDARIRGRQATCFRFQRRHLLRTQTISKNQYQRFMAEGRTIYNMNQYSSHYVRALYHKREQLRVRAMDTQAPEDRYRLIVDWRQNASSTLSLPDLEYPFNRKYYLLDHVFPNSFTKHDRQKRLDAGAPEPEPPCGIRYDPFSVYQGEDPSMKADEIFNFSEYLHDHAPTVSSYEQRLARLAIHADEVAERQADDAAAALGRAMSEAAIDVDKIIGADENAGDETALLIDLDAFVEVDEFVMADDTATDDTEAGDTEVEDAVADDAADVNDAVSERSSLEYGDIPIMNDVSPRPEKSDPINYKVVMCGTGPSQ
jgi:hypothetical protein